MDSLNKPFPQHWMYCITMQKWEDYNNDIQYIHYILALSPPLEAFPGQCVPDTLPQYRERPRDEANMYTCTHTHNVHTYVCT